AVGNNLFVNPDNTVDLTDKTLTTDTVVDIVPGVDAQIQYSFYSRYNSSRQGGVVRALYSVTNTTGADISTSMLVMGNYGSDAKTTVQGTSDGDLIVEASDYWVASNNYIGDTPEYVSYNDTVISSHGAGAAVVPVVAMTLGSISGGAGGKTDNFGYRYDVTVPAGETVRVMLFHEMSEWMTEALAAAPDFESLDAASAAGLLAGLSPTQLSEIVNYGVATDTDSDGVADNADAFPLNIAASVDADNDGLPDAWNAACDATCQAGSGLLLDTSLDDTDNDGVINGSDAFPNDPTETLDTDGDGVGDNADNCPADANADQADADGDGTGDVCEVPPGDSGALHPTGLLALFGLPALLRRRKNKAG
ncbi:MAG: thrombospondin type 3 repeat-containing protein, partial [Gammaproteobacteria bacterium]|nr:thrombospondin type 3 repeat-containing protein [Gammaproteobacteria bacterium]